MRASGSVIPPVAKQSARSAGKDAWRQDAQESQPDPATPSRTVSEVGLGPNEKALDIVIEGLTAEQRDAVLDAFPGGKRFNIVERSS